MELTKTGVLLTFAEFNTLVAGQAKRGGRPKGSKNKPKAGTKKSSTKKGTKAATAAS